MATAISTKSRVTTYRAKRDFAKTSEPAGKKAVPSSSKLRFVIQRHDAKQLHYDLRLELDGVFKSWAVTRGPSMDPHDKRLAVEVEDHPLDYGDFEGVIPKGQYGGGTVQLWDRGYWIAEGDPHDGLKRGNLKFSLEGKHLQGGWVLVRMKNDRMGGKRTNWLLIKHRDDDARYGDGDALLKDPESIASGRSLEEIAAGKGKAPTSFITHKPAAAGTSPPVENSDGKVIDLMEALRRSLDSRETGLREPPPSATSNARRAKPLPKPNPKRRRRPNMERGS